MLATPLPLVCRERHKKTKPDKEVKNGNGDETGGY